MGGALEGLILLQQAHFLIPALIQASSLGTASARFRRSSAKSPAFEESSKRWSREFLGAFLWSGCSKVFGDYGLHYNQKRGIGQSVEELVLGACIVGLNVGLEVLEGRIFKICTLQSVGTGLSITVFKVNAKGNTRSVLQGVLRAAQHC